MSAAVDMDDERGKRKAPNPGVDEVPCLLPTRWWFASTAFPLLAGTLGPMANAFSICSLSQDWRAELGTVGTGNLPKTIKDPSWLAITINSVSLGFALISNLSLLLNMARRVRFSVSQPITIGGWYIASALLVGLTVAVPRVTDLHGRQLTQAYYYAIMAAALYFFVSSLLLVTVYGANTGRYSKHFHLTTSQRSLMLQTILYMMYLLVGAAIFSRVENWSYLDALYWADFTLLTNGIGDLAPATHLGRSLLFPFAVGGILTLGLVVMSIRSMMIERARTQLTARTTEKTRKLVTEQLQSGDIKKRMLQPLVNQDNSLSDKELQQEEFQLMHRIHKTCAWQLRWLSLLISAFAWAILWLVGSVAFWLAERDAGWTYFTSLYFAYVNLLTIGYGDVVLVSHDELQDFGASNSTPSGTTTLFPSSSGGRSGNDYRTQQSIPLRELTRDPAHKSNHPHPYYGHKRESYQQSNPYGTYAFHQDEFYRNNSTPTTGPFGTMASDTVRETESNSRDFSYNASARRLREQEFCSSPGRSKYAHPSYERTESRSPPQSGGGESFHSSLRPDPLCIHKARSSPLTSVSPSDGYASGMAQPESSKDASQRSARYDFTGRSSPEYRHPRQDWLAQSQVGSVRKDSKWKQKEAITRGEHGLRTLEGSKKFSIERSRSHPFGKQHNRSSTHLSGTSATRHDNPRSTERPEEPYPISAGQTPVAYGLPPGNARSPTEFVDEADENKVERKLNLLDLVSQLRDRDI
ncbi:hypothetical protein GY631_3429 [Trichophyton interdigitale]|uniref:Potassium channel domain-containing protein n=1 Tax=Trichophyton interdigitale TaxID=101480 RepID=A0A9P4YH33_9EURO|nr:hypothetical protein GY631_3429 [Trichophyton interdigitale]KAF3894822.1 hypothetical protein GY632_3580 [Trichophyton interdigitale]